MQSKAHKHVSVAMTLVEVLVALAIVSMVFTALVQMTFDALKRAKNLELQDKMRSYASEAVQMIYTGKDTDWEATFGDGGILPATPESTTQYSLAYVQYPAPATPGAKTTTAPLLQKLPNRSCDLDSTNTIPNTPTCQQTSGDPSREEHRIFGRIIKRIDDNSNANEQNGRTDTINDAVIEITVACIQELCDPKQFKPFTLTFEVYRTSAPR